MVGAENQRAGNRLRERTAAANHTAKDLGGGIGEDEGGIVADVARHAAVVRDAVAQLQRAAADRGNGRSTDCWP